MKITPAILEQSYSEIKNKLREVEGLVDFVQIDVCDGIFVKSETWFGQEKNTDELQEILNNTNLKIEWDLMVENPEEFVKVLLQNGAQKIIIHARSISNPAEFIQELKNEYPNVSWGIAIMPNLEDARKYKDAIGAYDFVQCMGISHIGVQGEKEPEIIFDVIRKARELFPDKEISVDGGVTLQNAPALKDAGATRLISGSAIFQSSDIAQTINQFQNL